MNRFASLFLVVFVFVAVILIALVLGWQFAGASGQGDTRSDACRTYNAFAHQSIAINGLDGEFCGAQLVEYAPTKASRPHSDATPVVTLIVTETPVVTDTPVVTETPPTPTPEPVCQDDEDDGGAGEDDAIDDQEAEDCEDDDDSQ